MQHWKWHSNAGAQLSRCRCGPGAPRPCHRGDRQTRLGGSWILATWRQFGDVHVLLLCLGSVFFFWNSNDSKHMSKTIPLRKYVKHIQTPHLIHLHGCDSVSTSFWSCVCAAEWLKDPQPWRTPTAPRCFMLAFPVAPLKTWSSRAALASLICKMPPRSLMAMVHWGWSPKMGIYSTPGRVKPETSWNCKEHLKNILKVYESVLYDISWCFHHAGHM